MHQVRHRLVSATLLAAFALGAQAQPATPLAAPTSAGHTAHAPGPAAAPGGHRHRHLDPAEREARRAARQAAVKARLQITPAQEGAWTAFTAAMQPGARPARPDAAQRQALQALSTPERIDRMRTLRAERSARQDRRGDAIKTFYAALAPAQQKTFDALPIGKGGRHAHPHRHGDGAKPAAGLAG